MREIETAVRGFRWLGVAFALAQIGLLYQPPEGVAVPFPRLPVAGAFAGVLIVLNLASRWIARSDDERALRVWGWIQLAIDTLLVFTIVALFAFDDESRLWPLYVLPILEGALRAQIVGAVSGALAALLGNVVTFADRFSTGELLSSTAFQAGILLILAVTAGSLARRFEEARRDAERQAVRLRDLAEQASTLAAARETTALLQVLRDAACGLTGLERCEIHLRGTDGWRLVESNDPDDELPSLVDSLLTEPRVDDVVVISPDGPRARSVSHLLLAPIGGGDEPAALLALATADPERRITETDEDLVRLLVGHAAVALDNARIAEARGAHDRRPEGPRRREGRVRAHPRARAEGTDDGHDGLRSAPEAPVGGPVT
ncbi:MAG: hypothetical protein KY437_04995 [Actinobacteria bacterium]|nr:hypothetical protein [Actinomycetota bacterium]